MEIVLTDCSTLTSGDGVDISLAALNAFGHVTCYDRTSAEEAAERLQSAEAVLCNKTPLNQDTLAGADKLRYIGLFATGYNNIDLPYTKERGITVCNAPGYSTAAVVQHTFALILAFYNRVHVYHETIRAGDWVKSQNFSYFPIPLYELQGKTIGIVGFGAIGQQVARTAQAFGMRVMVHTRTPGKTKNTAFASFVQFVELEPLLAKADIVSLHCPLTEDTWHLMDKRAFSLMKKNALFINTARGAIVSEEALRDALLEGRLLGAGLDVLTLEPMDASCVLQGIDNCLITPHIAWAGVETRQRLIALVVENLRAFLSGKPQNVVS